MELQSTMHRATRLLQPLREYFATPLPHPKTFPRRLGLHLAITALVVLVAFTVNFIQSLTSLAALALCLICAWKTGLEFGLSYLLLDEWIAPRLPRGWGAFARRTVGRNYLISFAALLLALYLGRVEIPAFQGLLRPLIESASPRAELEWNYVELFLRVFPIWFLLMFALLHVRLKRQLQRDFERIAELNRILLHRQQAAQAGELRPAAPPAQSGGRGEEGANRKFVVSTASFSEALDPDAISHITIEEHYARIYIHENGEVRSLEVKLPLKEALARLPRERFIQVHRSHIVNMSHVLRVERASGSCQLLLTGGRYSLPVSRHRASVVLPSLQAYWQSA